MVWIDFVPLISPLFLDSGAMAVRFVTTFVAETGFVAGSKKLCSKWPRHVGNRRFPGLFPGTIRRVWRWFRALDRPSFPRFGCDGGPNCHTFRHRNGVLPGGKDLCSKWAKSRGFRAFLAGFRPVLGPIVSGLSTHLVVICFQVGYRTMTGLRSGLGGLAANSFRDVAHRQLAFRDPEMPVTSHNVF